MGDTMRFCCISDTHNKHEELDLTQYPADILISSGDVTSSGTKDELLRFLIWFEKQPFEYKIFIPGNHDRYIEDNFEDFVNVLTKFSGITLLHNSGINIAGINFWGSGDTPEFCNWAFNKTHEELVETWSNVPSNTDVLITHGPAYGILDEVNNVWSPTPNVGCKALRDMIVPSTIKYCIFGHIHEQGGKHLNIEGTDFYNVSVLDERYRMVNTPTIIEYKGIK